MIFELHQGFKEVERTYRIVLKRLSTLSSTYIVASYSFDGVEFASWCAEFLEQPR